MRYYIQEIKPNLSYGITIGSRVKPDSEFRDLVKSQIDRAMESFERESQFTHEIAIIPDWDSSESGILELPLLYAYGKQYLIFVILYSAPDTAESLSKEEIELYKSEIERMLSGTLGEEAVAALVLLQDCSVNVFEIMRNDLSTGGIWLI